MLQVDPATLDPETIFNGQCRQIRFEILQDELKARRLAAGFFERHRRESQAAVTKAAGVTCPALVEGNNHLTCNCWLDNKNRIQNLEEQLRGIVRKQLAI